MTETSIVTFVEALPGDLGKFRFLIPPDTKRLVLTNADTRPVRVLSISRDLTSNTLYGRSSVDLEPQQSVTWYIRPCYKLPSGKVVTSVQEYLDLGYKPKQVAVLHDWENLFDFTTGPVHMYVCETPPFPKTTQFDQFHFQIACFPDVDNQK